MWHHNHNGFYWWPGAYLGSEHLHQSLWRKPLVFYPKSSDVEYGTSKASITTPKREWHFDNFRCTRCHQNAPKFEEIFVIFRTENCRRYNEDFVKMTIFPFAEATNEIQLCLQHYCLWRNKFLQKPGTRRNIKPVLHYNDVMMSTIACPITSLTIVYSTVYSDADQRKHQSSASLAFVWGIHWGPVNSPHKWPVTRKMFPFDDVIMSRYGDRHHKDKTALRMGIPILVLKRPPGDGLATVLSLTWESHTGEDGLYIEMGPRFF